MALLPKLLYHGSAFARDCLSPGLDSPTKSDAPLFVSANRYLALQKGSTAAVRWNFKGNIIFTFHGDEILMEGFDKDSGVTLEKISTLKVTLFEIPSDHLHRVEWVPVGESEEPVCWSTTHRISIFSDRRTLRFCDIHQGKQLTIALPDGTIKTKGL